MGGMTHKLRPSPYLLQVTSRTLFFPVWNYPPHTFRSKRTPERLNLTEPKEWDHAVELIPGSKPAGCKIYPLSPMEQKELDTFLKENLEMGQIRPSKSPILSPVFFIKKKDSSLRLVQDYRALNTITIKNKYLLPLILKLINKLQGARYFTKLDVCWGFNNV